MSDAARGDGTLPPPSSAVDAKNRGDVAANSAAFPVVSD